MTVRFDTGQKDRRRHAVVVCGGFSCERPGCGRELDIDLKHSMSDKIAELAATEEAVGEHGWASDFPAWWTMMVGCSHLCPSCRSDRALLDNPFFAALAAMDEEDRR